jgi:O-antigen ligase
VTSFPYTAAPGHEPARFGERLAFGLAVFLLLIYSQGWVSPISGGGDNADAAGLIRALYYPAYAAGLMVLFGCLPETLRVLWRVPLLVFLLVLAAASTSWSIDPATTTRRVVALVLTTLGGVALAARFDWRKMTLALALTFAILGVASLLLCLAVPSLGRMEETFPGAWRGVWFEKNALGGNMALGFVVSAAAAVLDPGRRRFWWGCAGLAVVLVLASTSKTSLVALLLGAGALAFVALARRGPAAGVVLVWLAVVAVGVVAAVWMFASDVVFDALGKDATLTGRTKIWAGAIRQIHERPVWGWGYGAIWDNENPWAPLAKITQEAGFRARHAHSSWVEMALNLGLVGAAVWALWFLEAWVRALIGVFTSRGAYLAVPFLTVYGMTSLTESVTLTWNDLRWVMFVAVAVKLVLGERAADQEEARAPAPAPVRLRAAWP